MRQLSNRQFILSLIVTILLLAPTGASAVDKSLVPKGQGMSQSIFDPAIDTKGHFTMDGSPVLPHLSFSLGLMLDFGFNNWVSVEQNENQQEFLDGTPYAYSLDAYNNAILERMITARFQFNLGLWDRVAVGLQIPIAVPFGKFYQVTLNDNGTLNGVNSQYWSSKGTFGDIDLHIKVSALRSDWHPIGISFIAQYLIPSGKAEYFTGEPGGGAFVFKAILDSEPTMWYRVGLNAGIRLPLGEASDNYLAWNTDYPPTTGFAAPGPTLLFHYGPMLYFGLGQSFNIWPGIMDLVLEFYGNQLLSETDNLAYLSLEANGGFKVFIEESSYLMAGYAHGIPTGATESGYGFQSMEHRFFLGFCYEPSMAVRIKDDEMDRDGDGILDKDDQCPDDPEDMNGIQDEDGCPENDMDGDGIKDNVDKCPLVKEDKDGDADTDGCPEQSAMEASAVAEAADRDLDRIPDVKDQCPENPETYNGRDDEDGCPDEGDVVVTNSSLMILKKVNFETASDKILPESFRILDEVALTINNNPQITAIEVQGHADERGADKYNLKLTIKRAAAVRNYLIDKGVDRDKLKSQGYGEYCPIDEESNDQAWEKNRRVEFKVVEMNSAKTGVKCGCDRAEAAGIRSSY